MGKYQEASARTRPGVTPTYTAIENIIIMRVILVADVQKKSTLLSIMLYVVGLPQMVANGASKCSRTYSYVFNTKSNALKDTHPTS